MDLQSIVLATRAVPFCGGTVDIVGLSFRKLTGLVVRYPELLALASGKADFLTGEILHINGGKTAS